MADPRPIGLPVVEADTGVRGRLATLAARRRALDPAALARRRLVVTITKRLLPLAAFGALALIVLWPQLAGMEERVRVAYRKPSITVPTGAASVVEPRFLGTDERGRPYTVSADSAVQEAGSESVRLARPRGDVTLEDGAWVLLQADAGLFHRNTRMLDLTGNVAVFHDSGYEVRTDAAEVDLRAGAAHGDQPVSAQGPAGTLDAVGFSLTDRGDVVVFKGPARMVLVPTARPAP
ncbi:MAG: LPS export ABC transporter periplasmic protein LptC [Acetobacteraceae bacterium]|jgi:lipopolysaccharide export system protein LptC|nr:LPS export ABC transporter periplasmic protein LptC [Acetobacteraceae bacterium]